MTYKNCKKWIEIGKYVKEDLLNTLDIFLLNKRINETEYQQLVVMINNRDILEV